jgi:hypothetical protein
MVDLAIDAVMTVSRLQVIRHNLHEMK